MVRRDKLVTLIGQEQLDKALNELKRTRAKAVVRRAARMALKPTLKQIRKNAPKQRKQRGKPRTTPVLSRAFRIRTMTKGSRPGARITTLRERFGLFFYGGFIEWGTRHIKARTFVKDAVDATKTSMYNILFREVGKGIIREARKAAKK